MKHPYFFLLQQNLPPEESMALMQRVAFMKILSDCAMHTADLLGIMAEAMCTLLQKDWLKHVQERMNTSAGTNYFLTINRLHIF